MTRDTLPPRCARTDAVLALYLDGDVDGDGLESSGFGLVCGASLRDHLLACATCRTQLLRARRLDARLATQAGRAVDGDELEQLATRWFAALEPIPTTPRRATFARAAGLALLLLLPLAIAAFWWWTGTPSQAATVPMPATPPPTESTPVEPAATGPVLTPPTTPPQAAGDILIASDAPQRRARQPRADAAQRAPAPADLQSILVDACLPATERLTATERLVAVAAGGRRTEGAAAFAALLAALAALGDRDGDQCAFHRRALDVVRNEAHLLGQVLADLQRLDTRRGSPARGDLALLTVAARLGDRALDLAIERAVRRHPDLADPLAAALRCDVRAAGGASLLLDIWQDLTARGELAGDAAGPCAWFAGQPLAVFDEVERILRTTRSAPRRVQCLLALGQGSSERSLAVLCEHVRQAPFLEAHAAAFALSQRPRSQLEPLVARARDDDSYLLRAALALAAVPEAVAWIDALALGEAERALLANASFPDFPRVASWFRDRTFALGD